MKDYGSLTREDYWLSAMSDFNHITLPMSVQCRLFPRTTLGVTYPLRDAKGDRK